MAMNLHVENLADTTVNISSLLDIYFIDAAAGTTYTYNLPSIVSDGQKFTLVRIDGTTGIVNLTGTMNINGTSISTFKIFPLSTVVVMSLNAAWYIVCSESTSPNNSNVVFNASFNNNINTPYAGFSTVNAVMFYFLFLGRNNYSTISTIVMTLGTAATGNTEIILSNSLAAVLCTFTVTTGSSVAVYNLTAAEKDSLPTALSYLYLQRGAGTAINVSSVLIYS